MVRRNLLPEVLLQGYKSIKSLLRSSTIANILMEYEKYSHFAEPQSEI